MANENIRQISADALVEILEHKTFSHILLKQVLDKYGYLQKNERAFINRLVSGTVEQCIKLDYIIDNYSKTKVKKMKPFIRTILRMGCFEIYFMDSVPGSATCNEYVKLAKKRGFSGLSGFVNGVLRSIIRGKDSLSFDSLDIRYSMPKWIVDMWCKDYSKETCEEILEGFLQDSQLSVRVNINKTTTEELIEILAKEGVTAISEEAVPGLLYLSGIDKLSDIKAFNDGLFYVQDYSSQLVALKAELSKTDRVLDVCAAPGGKALHCAQLVSEGSVEARDLTESKVALINENIAKAGVSNITAKQFDATVFDAAAVGKFDVVIADLPCSGLGIIRKKPDIKYNQTSEALKELEALQAQILDNVASYVKPGGKLVHSTCTINKGENDLQVDSFIKRHSEYSIISREQLFPTKEHDGFYICVMKK